MKAETALRGADNSSFLSEPIGVSLAGFKEFDFDGTASWSQIELYAAAVGKEIDMAFVKAILVISYYCPELDDALLEEIKTSDRLDCFVGTVEFVECVFKLWGDTPYYGVWSEITAEMLKCNIKGVFDRDIDWTKDGKTRRKYEMLSALDAKFPYLLVKFYASRAKDIHTHDSMFMMWLRRRVEARSARDPASARILRAMDNDISRMNRTAMFMS